MSGPEWDPKWGPPPPPPEPGSRAEDQVRAGHAGRPGLVDAFTVLMVLSSVWSAVRYARTGWLCIMIGFGIDLLVLYLFWQGRAWARYLVLFGSFLSLFGFGVFLIPAEIRAQIGDGLELEAVFNASLGLAMLVGLNTKAVREYYLPPPPPGPRRF